MYCRNSRLIIIVNDGNIPWDAEIRRNSSVATAGWLIISSISDGGSGIFFLQFMVVTTELRRFVASRGISTIGADGQRERHRFGTACNIRDRCHSLDASTINDQMAIAGGELVFGFRSSHERHFSFASFGIEGH
jgi:hypothetical protein